MFLRKGWLASFAALSFLAVAGCTGLPDGIKPVDTFNAQRYAGEWYEIMRLDHPFERGLTNVRAVYAVRPDGKLQVTNKGYNPKTCRWSDIEGSAVLQGAPNVASLSVTFFAPFAGGYHIFALDKDYRWAMVSGPSKDYLWILSRTPTLDPKIRTRLVVEAKAKGFPVDQLILVDQGTPRCDTPG